VRFWFNWHHLLAVVVVGLCFDCCCWFRQCHPCCCGGYGSANTGFVKLLVLCSLLSWLFFLLFVCSFGFWFPGLFPDLLRFAGIKTFNSPFAALEKLGRRRLWLWLELALYSLLL
jgi:hypothetical protein